VLLFFEFGVLSSPGLSWRGFPGLASLGGARQVQHVAHEQPAAGHVRAALDRPAVPVGGRRFPGQPGEQRRERAEAAEPDQVADLGHGQVGVAQQVLGPLDPAAAEVPDRGQPVGGLEAPGEVVLRHPGHPGEPVQVKRGRVVLVDVVVGPPQVGQQLHGHPGARRCRSHFPSVPPSAGTARDRAVVFACQAGLVGPREPASRDAGPGNGGPRPAVSCQNYCQHARQELRHDRYPSHRRGR
jgi:hypothetical protein